MTWHCILGDTCQVHQDGALDFALEASLILPSCGTFFLWSATYSLLSFLEFTGYQNWVLRDCKLLFLHRVNLFGAVNKV